MPSVSADESQTVQPMQNLVSNAIKLRGVARLRIHISVTKVNDMWKFAAADNGIGPDKNYSDKISQMFQRLHTRDEYPRNGAGLAIAKKMVERHGGKLWVESMVGKGATFYFILSVREADG
jgi:chemotaxis family two-component system sensor kinase Cph1